jgi:phosphoribosylformylglycinamidine cyclo-ligase
MKVKKRSRDVKSRKITYASAGVDIDRADFIKSKIKDLAKKTLISGVIEGVGPFSAVLKSEGEILLATCDGVGTKILLGLKYKKEKWLGKDLVAMNVNDILAMHGKPKFFLDYIGVNSLDDVDVLGIVEGIVEACEESGCSLVGGETAQMPGFYRRKSVELVGFCIGFANSNSLPKINNIKKGDLVIAFPSAGIHSNGFSLVRKLISQKEIKIDSDFGGEKLYNLILAPTKIYVKDFFKIVEKFGFPKASAHITGGGIPGNLSRVIPDGLSAFVEKKVLKDISENYSHNIFSLFYKFVEEKELFRVFNMGLGFAMIYDEATAKKITENFSDVFIVGFIDNFKKEKVVIV